MSESDRTPTTGTERLARAPFVALAFALPMIGLGLHHDLGHEGDIAFFHEWYLAFRDGSAFYRDGPGLNYPIVGVLVVCLPASLVDALRGGPLELEAFRLVLKLTLALAESAAILAFARLGRALALPAPRTLALVFALLPLSWAPGAWFGQIDVVGTALLLAALERGLVYRATGEAGPLLTALLATHAAILTKQLVLFTLPALGVLGVLALVRHRRAPHVLLVGLSPLLWFVADPFLALPAGWRSHLAFVLFGGGSAHGDFIVAGGASLWSLVADLNVSAHDWRVLGVSAYVMGIVAYLLLQGGLLWRLAPRRDSDAAIVLYAGLSHLGMATLLTGVHERYVVHGAPLLLLGLAGLRAGRRWWVGSAAVLSWWGLFVLGSLHFDAFRGVLLPFRMHQPIAVLLLALLCALLFRARGQPFARGRR